MYSRLLVPLDGSSTANLALHHAAVLARLSGATIILLHIIEEMKHSNGFERPRIWRFSLYVLVNTLIPPDNHDFVSSRRCSFTLNQAK